MSTDQVGSRGGLARLANEAGHHPACHSALGAALQPLHPRTWLTVREHERLALSTGSVLKLLKTHNFLCVLLGQRNDGAARHLRLGISYPFGIVSLYHLRRSVVQVSDQPDREARAKPSDDAGMPKDVGHDIGR